MYFGHHDLRLGSRSARASDSAAVVWEGKMPTSPELKPVNCSIVKRLHFFLNLDLKNKLQPGSCGHETTPHPLNPET